MAGCGSNSTDESIDLVDHAYKSGAKGTLLVTPYYNKPTQRVCMNILDLLLSLVLIYHNYLYNIPGRSVVKY